MVSFLDSLVFWHWWILAIAMVILETLAPGMIFLWLGLGAAAVGAVLLAVPGLDWNLQLVGFACLSVISGFGGRLWLKRHPQESANPLLNQRGAQYIGQTFTLDSPITNGTGKMPVGDGEWKINGPDMPAGSRVKVVGSKGASLVIKKVND
ncbi:MAG: NfeD family protein [Rhodospirillales bacterium]|nr:NfeD family protein [Rhodospirillales bacterium]